jgi:predicted transcriptional regulator
VKKTSFILFFLWCAILPIYAGIVQGKVTDEKGVPMPFASVFVKNTTTGTATNSKGDYWLELAPGSYTVVYSFVGYVPQEIHVEVTRTSQHVQNIVLKEDNASLGEITIYADTRDRAKEIMREVRKMRPEYLKAVEFYTCTTYLKTALDKKVKLSADSAKKDTVNVTKDADLNQFFKRENLNLIESLSVTYFERPKRYKEHFLAHKSYTETKGSVERGASVGITLGESMMAPQPQFTDNPNILYQDILSCDFNFYENQIAFPEVSQMPLLSPLAETAGVVYQFDLEGSFYEDQQLIYKIKVSPLFKTDAAFIGHIYVEDSTWVVRLVDLAVNPRAMVFCKEFHIIQNYQRIDGYVVPVNRELSYTLKDDGEFILGNTRIRHSNYVINLPAAKTKWTNEIKSFDPDALDKPREFWEKIRPIQLQNKELDFIHMCDSLTDYFSSAEYYRKSDSIFNHISWWAPLVGVGRRNSFIKQEWYIEGLLNQVQPFGIGGYRHKLPGYYNKEFANDHKLEVDGFVDYGFKNRDVKGKMGVGWTYVPKKFVRTYINVGDYYAMINDFASFAQVFSRSNFARHVSFSLAQRMEIVNGLFVEATFNFSDQRPINNLQLENWSNEVFGALNTPINFERYIKSEFVLEAKYRIKQQYMIKGNKKIILQAKHPEITAKYKKGVPGLLNSEVNYDFLELTAHHHIQLKRWGTSTWRVNYGNFMNTASLRVLEHKYFRGSDEGIFSNPLKSFQLLGPTLSSSNSYLMANYMHHFEGSITNKIPFINRLKLELAGGGGLLIIEDIDFRHAEIFAGIERPFKLWGQLFKIGFYGVTAYNTLDRGDFTFKIGANMYNAFTRRWDY